MISIRKTGNFYPSGVVFFSTPHLLLNNPKEIIMKNTFVAVSLLLFGALSVQAAETPQPGLDAGIDFGMPYVLKANGGSVKERGNMNMGLSARYWTNDNVNYAVRLAFDLEEKLTNRQIVLAPGLQYHFMEATSALRPYVRGDLPITLMGAPNTGGVDSKQDIGLAAGVGVAWNMGEAVGVENLSMRYDFDMAYNFGMGDAVTVLSLDIFKIGFDYRF
jgi:hypothetical protein